MSTQSQVNGAVDRMLAYRVLRYTPNLLRDEWVKGVEALPLEGLAVWTAKMRPLIQ
jgi:hypothetical protein